MKNKRGVKGKTLKFLNSLRFYAFVILLIFNFGIVFADDAVFKRGDFSVDTKVFYVNSTLNRVGINITNPTDLFQVEGNAQIKKLGLNKQNNAALIPLDIKTEDGGQGIRVEMTTITDKSFSSFLTGDSLSSFSIRGDGLLSFGSGSLSSDTNLYRLNVDTLKTDDSLTIGKNFSVDGITLFVDDVSNNIGISTTSPTQKLDIRGNVNISGGLWVDNSTLVNHWLYNESAIVFTQISNQNASWISTYNATYAPYAYNQTLGSGWIKNGTNIHLISNSDNVGIGITSPQDKFQVYGGQIVVNDTVGSTGISEQDGSILVERTNSGIVFGSRLAGAEASTNRFFIYQDTANTYLRSITSGDNIIFGTDNSNDMIILSGGNVIIGSTINGAGANTLFQVQGSDSSTREIAYFNGSANQDYSRVTIDSYGDSGLSFMANRSSKWTIGNDASDNSFHIRSGVGTFNSNDTFVMTTNGYLGIGIGSPLSLLHINNNSGSNPQVRVSNDANNGNASIRLYARDGSGSFKYGDIFLDARKHYLGLAVGTTSADLPPTQDPEVKVLSGGQVVLSNLVGTGNDYVCVNATGGLYRSDSVCS